MLNTLLPLLSFALLYLVLRRLPHVLAVSRARSFLPSHRLTRPAVSDKPGWNLERHGITTSLWTSALNGVPRGIVGRLRPPAHERLKQFYGFGAGVGILGGVVGVGGLVWAWMGVWKRVFDEASEHVGRGEGQRMIRRALDMAGASHPATTSSSGGLLQPVIPGLTAPLDHFLTLMLALLLNQLIHETGHAICAALENIDPTRLSFNLHLILPSATVSFPSSVDYLSGLAKVHVAASGAWHNILTYLIIYLAGVAGGRSLFWHEAGHQGRTVYSVDARSALTGYLSPGDLIVHLDDVPLGGLADSWESYLTGSIVGDQGKGWCLTKTALASTLSFERADAAASANRLQYCLSPRPLLDGPSAACVCGSEEICLRPSATEHILRIGVSRGSETEVVLFAGERFEVYDAVRVGTSRPRLWTGGTFWASLLMSYISNIALSLFFFNLLPLPSTDGSAIVQALLSLISSGSTFTLNNPRPIRASLMGRSRTPTPTITTPTITLYREYELDSDDEGGAEEGAFRRESTGRREEVWQRRLRRIIDGITTALVVGWAAGWFMLALLRSS